ncbi:MAG: GT4 family glycosyltransferase PelF [Candidatus Omnitrophota bacterium]|nr:GT4 family glycosyltransferase PelF [Candidatus Omnitrophota bacterium]
MNILQILPELNVGGVETGTVDLAKYLVRFGHKAVVVSAGGELVEALSAVGAIHYRLQVNKKSIISILKLIPELAEIIRKEKIDIVHSRSRVPAWIAYFAARRTKTVFITTCHGYYKKHPFSAVMGWGKRVIALSNVIARHMRDDFNCPSERIRIIARSVDLEKFKYTDPKEKRKKDEFNVGIIARITPLKGHLDFIKAMAKIARVIPNLKIWIVGDSPASKEAYKEELQILARRLGLSHCTNFLGTQRNIPEILSHLDLLVLATRTQEAFGRVIIEAQASGVPVVATGVGGVVDIIENEKTGLLVPVSDPERLAVAAIRIFKDPELGRNFAQEAYKKVKDKYNIELMVKNTLDVYEEALSNYNILVIKFSSLGDVVLSSAALRAIREKFKTNYKISLLVSAPSKDAVLASPYIDELLVVDFNGKDKGWLGFLRLGRELRKKNFDIVIDLQNNRKSHILAILSLALERYGYDRKFGFLLNHRLKEEKVSVGALAHQFRILKMLGIDLTDSRLEVWPLACDIQYVDEFLGSQWLSAKGRIVGLNISASQKWQTKNWLFKHMVKFCEELGRRDMRVVLTGTEKDNLTAEALLKSVKNARLINTCGKTTINQLACLIKRCSVFVSCDSSPLHIAAAVGTPFVALFGATDPKRHLAQVKECLVIKKDLACSPCYKPRCRNKKCMELITPQEVLEAVEKLVHST